MELPSEAHIQRLVQAYCRFLANADGEIGDRPFVLPNADFFPDPFHADLQSAKRLVSRLQEHAGLADVPIEVELVESSGPSPSGGSCGTGACAPGTPEEGVARLSPTVSGWTLRVSESELDHPVGLTTGLARAVAHIFLLEIDDSRGASSQPEDQIDIAAVGLGLGPVVLQGSYIYSKSCGGPNVAQLTKLNVGEVAILTALFAELGSHPVRKAQKDLDPTQRALLGEASGILRRATKLIDQIRKDPAAAAENPLPLTASEGFFGRLFGKRRSQDADFEAALMGGDDDALRRQFEASRTDSGGTPKVDPAEEAKRRDLRMLVDEAFKEEASQQDPR